MKTALMWSKKEKEIARGAFKVTLERESLDLLSRLKEMADTAENREDVWKIHDFLTERRTEIDQKYDYRYSMLIPIFGRLIREGWIRLDELEGFNEDKIAEIKIFAGLE
jgi:hypothetical protein